MAKSLRSKTKRANRAQLRKNLSDPIIKRRQEQVAAALAATLEKKTGKSILGLKSTFSVAGAAESGAIDEFEEEEEEGAEELAAAVSEESQNTKKMAQKLLLKEKLKKLKSSRKEETYKKKLFEFK